MADWLFDRYPEEMTIVIQHWFDGLFVGDDGFQITLNFGDSPEPLSIPFEAIRTFVDPSVEFGLRFETPEGHHEEQSDPEMRELPEFAGGQPEQSATSSTHETATDDKKGKPAEVVSLDSFRKS